MSLHSFLLASQNVGKIKEFQKLRDAEILTIELPESPVAVNESGDSYWENSLLKARSYYKKYQTPILSDDSGLEIESLPFLMGVQSARFGGEQLSDSERNQLLLDRMREFNGDKRKASFVAVLCFYFSEQKYFFFEGRCHGIILEFPAGNGGFGQDPIFSPGEHPESGIKSMSQLLGWKNEYGHRAKALKFAEGFFRKNP